MEDLRLLIVKTGSAEPKVAARHGDFEAWIVRGLGVEGAAIEVAEVFEDAALPAAASVSGIVVTGSSAFVSTREAWSERTAAWLRSAVSAGTPLLGICYGHQLLAHALGGRVGRNPNGREIGTVEIDLGPAIDAADPLLGRGPERAYVQVSHVESVLELPPHAEWLARSEMDPFQAFAVGDSAWGVQFHPEFAIDVIRGYLGERRDALRDEGIDADSLLAETRETPWADELLSRFGEIVVQNARL